MKFEPSFFLNYLILKNLLDPPVHEIWPCLITFFTLISLNLK
jgi:hypothetical protein